MSHVTHWKSFWKSYVWFVNEPFIWVKARSDWFIHKLHWFSSWVQFADSLIQSRHKFQSIFHSNTQIVFNQRNSYRFGMPSKLPNFRVNYSFKTPFITFLFSALSLHLCLFTSWLLWIRHFVLLLVCVFFSLDLLCFTADLFKMWVLSCVCGKRKQGKTSKTGIQKSCL